MTSDPRTSCFPQAQSLGFVVAMRAKRIDADGRSHREWMIVSRWGTQGEHVSIGWTAVPAAPGGAPLHLTPCQTAVAVRQDRSGGWTTFRFVSSQPIQLTVAGDFVPADGYVRLNGIGSTLRMRSEGACLNPALRPNWNMTARRAPWIGEFVEREPGP